MANVPGGRASIGTGGLRKQDPDHPAVEDVLAGVVYANETLIGTLEIGEEAIVSGDGFDAIFAEAARTDLLAFGGKSIIYTPVGKPAASISALLDHSAVDIQDGTTGDVREQILRIEVSQAEVPIATPQSDRITVDGEEWALSREESGNGLMRVLEFKRAKRKAATGMGRKAI